MKDASDMWIGKKYDMWIISTYDMWILRYVDRQEIASTAKI